MPLTTPPAARPAARSFRSPFAWLFIAALALAGCSAENPSTASPTPSPSPEPVADPRIDTDPFSRDEKADLCARVAEAVEASDVVDGTAEMDVVDEDDWFCRITGVDWTAVPEAATVELGFHEYSDGEIQGIRDRSAVSGRPLTYCQLVVFDDGELGLSEVTGDVPHCLASAIDMDLSYVTRNATVITVRLLLGEDGWVTDLDGDAATLRVDVLHAIDAYSP